MGLIVLHAERACAAGQLPQGALFAQDLQKVQHIEVDLAPKRFVQQGAALFFRDAGDAEQVEVLRVTLQDGRNLVQLAQNAGLQPFLRG